MGCREPPIPSGKHAGKLGHGCCGPADASRDPQAAEEQGTAALPRDRLLPAPSRSPACASPSRVPPCSPPGVRREQELIADAKQRLEARWVWLADCTGGWQPWWRLEACRVARSAPAAGWADRQSRLTPRLPSTLTPLPLPRCAAPLPPRRFLPLLRPRLVPYQLHLWAERVDATVQRVAEILQQ